MYVKFTSRGKHMKNNNAKKCIYYHNKNPKKIKKY